MSSDECNFVELLYGNCTIIARSAGDVPEECDAKYMAVRSAAKIAAIE